MNRFQNIMIIGSRDNFIGLDFQDIDVETNKAPISYYFGKQDLSIDREEVYASNINALYILNKYLRSIYKLRNEKEFETFISYIAIPDSLCKIIKDATYKGWVLKKTYKDGSPINEVVLKHWIEFADLYSQLFLHVEFKGLNYFNMEKPKYNYKNIIYKSNLIKRCKQILDNKSMEILETVLC